MFTRRAMIAGTVAMPFAARAAEADSPTAADMADDIEILRQALELHPGLYRYASPRETEARVNRLARDWSGAPTLEARYLHLSRFLGTILCGARSRSGSSLTTCAPRLSCSPTASCPPTKAADMSCAGC